MDRDMDERGDGLPYLLSRRQGWLWLVAGIHGATLRCREAVTLSARGSTSGGNKNNEAPKLHRK